MTQKKRESKRIPAEAQEDLALYSASQMLSFQANALDTLNKKFKPNAKQIEFINTIKSSTITICSGASGSGKTISALYAGLEEALNGSKKLMVVRPVVEATQQGLGFLPGDLQDKLDPYFRATMYTLEELLGSNTAEKLVASKRIELEVLNFVRGATLTNRIIVVDEAQNFTLDDMMLAITRLGRGSKIIFTGDFFQSDLKKAKGSIMELAKLISVVKGVSQFSFSHEDVVRNPILVEITKIWEEYKSNNKL